MLADKTGEIGFINLKNLHQIPEPQDVKESVEYSDMPYYKTLYGHQEACLGLKFMKSGNRLLSWDTLNKVTVTNWPNVFNNDSQLLEHSETIQFVVPLANDQVASMSGRYGQTLIVSTHDGKVLRRSE
jgi:hypothetical protein